MLEDLFAPAPDQVLKVIDLTRKIKTQIERNFSQFWVEGEVSNLRKQSSGHVYFSLKDSGSQLPCVLFARDARNQSFELKDGMQVQLFGDLSVYEPHGRYQMIAKVALQSGQGRLQIQLEHLKRKLYAEGIFDAERKRPLPPLPLKIAVITSPTGAAIADFTRILKRRNYQGNVVIFPARVQGKEAAGELIRMLEYANASSGFDLAVLTRGGGSIEDLWSFNEEAVTRAVAASQLPVISAVGHEIDTVLTDYAADHRAETPSGAAELISSLYLDTETRISNCSNWLGAIMQSELEKHSDALKQMTSRMGRIAPNRQIEMLELKLDDSENRLVRTFTQRIKEESKRVNRLTQSFGSLSPKSVIRESRLNLKEFDRRIQKSLLLSRQQKKNQADQLNIRLKNSSLAATLKRGFAVVQKKNQSILSRAAQIEHDSEVDLKFFDGEITATVNKSLKE